MKYKVLDACCGPKMFWFDKGYPGAIFNDIRQIENERIWVSKDKKEVCDISVDPSIVSDFRKLPFKSGIFSLVVFDPPHICEFKISGWQTKKYGILSPKTWEEDIFLGFQECLRVLKVDGTLILKWNEVDKPVSLILKALKKEPLFGHKSGKQQKTHWLVFMKTLADSL